MGDDAGSPSTSALDPSLRRDPPHHIARLGLATPLRISTEHHAVAAHGPGLSPSQIPTHNSNGNLRPLSRTPSIRSVATHGLGSTTGNGSVFPSPIITAMGNMTPLPSPLLSGDSPGPWRKLSIGSGSPPMDRGTANGGGSVDSVKRKLYTTVDMADPAPHPLSHEQQAAQGSHQRNRSVSDYTPETATTPKRSITVSGSHIKLDTTGADDTHMRRELNFADSRGLTPTVTQPPTPPPSESSKDSSDGGKPKHHQGCEYFDARARADGKMRRWRSIGYLGQGTFSRVMLATSQLTSNEDDAAARPATPASERHVDRKKLVAVKVCEHGPRGGSSEERVEMSLKRELEILQGIHHPSLVHLLAWRIEPTRAILVLTYSPGGDLFEVATAHRDALTCSLLRRIFAELVGAVRYLHEQRIVHRDIKLENVLVNLEAAQLMDSSTDWATFPQSVVTLTDLGLSRRISDGELLETRCGSDDYAAPEVIMGQPYDGRATDAWSLGVLLYALLEARLPFDPHPGMSDAHRMRSRTSHRIARVEWRWVEYGGDEGDHEADLAKFERRGLVGAMEVTEGLLKRARSRWSVDQVAAQPWMRDAIRVDGGLRFWEAENGKEV
ncbi:CAMK protein kinase [Ophiocordyceps camponoti-floridani]|uniref:CAMK protein kinase n=1 Tax=Ophiocordyceps camponoti-floridani TaxID=2030778 RepID=A0A8H4QA27_9HYPO|nr:CAMK protein kinase [Ophiocordyceps camponoti-floridani]